MVDQFILEHALALSVAMMALGIGFILFILRSSGARRPQGGLQWAVVTLSLLVILLAGFTFVQALQPEAPAGPEIVGIAPGAEGVAVDRPAENFSFRLVGEDTPVDLESYRGDVVLLNFWATWCAPCLVEMPELNRLQETYRDQGLSVLTVSDEQREELLAFQRQMPLRTISGYIEDPTLLPDPFRRMLEARPMTFVIDRQGVIREAMVGNRTFEMFEEAVVPYLEQDLAVR